MVGSKGVEKVGFVCLDKWGLVYSWGVEFGLGV